MTDEATHLKVVEVDDADEADVTLEGAPDHVAELCESIGLDTLLQTELGKWENRIDEIDVEVKPRNGLSGVLAEDGE